MAHRPIFFIPNSSAENRELVLEREIEFHWHPGMAASQKKKNVAELHEAAKQAGYEQLLEVSTKSDTRLGIQLSAFNLVTRIGDIRDVPLESAFQGSKVFANGGPYTDLYEKKGGEAKRDERLLNSGELNGFRFKGRKWPLVPMTMFYDWLYISALHSHESLREQVRQFRAFTDIEFNPKRSINCQARSCALYVALCNLDKVSAEVIPADPESFVKMIGPHYSGQLF